VPSWLVIRTVIASVLAGEMLRKKSNCPRLSDQTASLIEI
jgi:hypothetical protein